MTPQSKCLLGIFQVAPIGYNIVGIVFCPEVALDVGDELFVLRVDYISKNVGQFGDLGIGGIKSQVAGKDSGSAC